MPTNCSDNKTLKLSTIAQIGLGVGEVVGGLVNGEIQDRLGTRKALIANLVQVFLAFGVSLVYIINNHFTLWFAFLMNFAWGLQDSGVNVFAETICGFQFKGSLEMPFSIYFFCQSFFCFLGTYVMSALTTPLEYAILYVVCAVLCLIAWAVFGLFFKVLEETDETGDVRASMAEERRERLSSYHGSDRGSNKGGSTNGDEDDEIK